MNNTKTYAKVIKITDDCINCGACEIECPVHAVKVAPNFSYINNNSNFKRFTSSIHFYIDAYKCNHCAEAFSSPRCNEVCPVACCISEEDNTIIEQLVQPSKLNKFSKQNQFLKLNPLLFANIGLN